MDFADWMARARGGEVALIKGGTLEMMDRVFTFDYGAPTRVLCTPAAMRRLASDHSLAFLPHVAATTVDNLRKHFDDRAVRERQGSTFVTADTLDTFLTSELRFCRRHADLLGGYETPLPVLEACAGGALWEILASVAAAGGGPLVVHDAANRLPTDPFEGLTVFDVGEARGAIPGSPPEDRPTEAQILQHASFVGGTDLGALRAMHEPLHRQGYRPLFAFWTAQFESMAGSQSHGDIVADAVARLDRVFPR